MLSKRFLCLKGAQGGVKTLKRFESLKRFNKSQMFSMFQHKGGGVNNT